MIINIKVFPKASKNQIRQDSDTWKAYINQPAIEGRANKALIELVAKHFDITKSNISIIKGEKSRRKVLKIVGL